MESSQFIDIPEMDGLLNSYSSTTNQPFVYKIPVTYLENLSPNRPMIIDSCSNIVIQARNNKHVRVNNKMGIGLDPSSAYSLHVLGDVCISGNLSSNDIVPLFDRTSNLGSVTNKWKSIFVYDLSVVSINGAPISSFGGGSDGGTSNSNLLNLTSDIIPFYLNVGINPNLKLGSVTNYWGNAYIRDISATNISVSSNLNPLVPNSGTIGLVNRAWGNAYINDISISCIDISVNLNPLVPNKGTIGLVNRRWGNAYINDISVVSIDISVNLNPLVPNKGTIGLVNKPWGNAYINDVSVASIDVSVNLNPLVHNKGSIGLVNKSWGNAYINDISVASIDISVNLNPLFPNKGSIGLVNKSWGNAYINDISVSCIDISVNLNPLVPNKGTIGLANKLWGNAYINDISVASIDVSVNLNPLVPNKGSIGLSNRRWGNAYINDVSVSSIDVSVNLNPLVPNKGSIGLVNKPWGNAYINDISVASIDISVNLNPLVPNKGTIGVPNKAWGNAYINDISVSSIDISVNLNPLNNNSGSLGINVSSSSFIGVSYELNTTPRTWFEHRSYAVSLGKTLAVILNEEQNEQVRLVLAGNNAFIGGARIGGSTNSAGITSLDWFWVTGDTWSYTNFANGQPENAYTQVLLQILANGKWDDTFNQMMSAVYMTTTNIITSANSKIWGNAHIRDISASSIDISVNLNPLVPNKGTIGVPNKAWGNAYINDVSAASIDISVNLNPLVPNKGTIGVPNKAWGNAYINDISATNIEPLSNNTSNLGSLTKRWNNIYTTDLNATNISVNQLTVTTLSQDNITNVINSLLTRITTLEARSNVYKIEYLRWYNSFTMNGLGGFDGFAMNTAGGDAPATFVKIANTKIAIKTSFRYTCAGFNGDYLLSKLSIYQGTNFILEGSFVEQLWTGANGGGTRSGTLTDCSVFMDTPSHIAMSGTLIVKLEISKTGLDDPLQLGPGYFEVIHLYN